MHYRLNDKDVVSEVLDGEVIVIHLQSGTYYSTLASGADIWNALLSGRSVEEIADWLARDAEEERCAHCRRGGAIRVGVDSRKPNFIEG